MSARDAIPGLFAAPPARATLRKYNVSIKFEDGNFQATAWAGSANQAHELVRVGARTGLCTGTFYGPELGWAAELAKVG